MPIKYLKTSEKSFFIEKEGYAIAIRDELGGVLGNEALKSHMKDVLEYRTMEYYRRRYVEKEQILAHANQCEVIVPKHFRDEIQKAIMEAYKIYW